MWSLILCLSVLAASPKEVKPVKYPQVVAYRGKIEIQTGKDKAPRIPKLKEILREYATVKTEAKSQIEIAISESKTLTLMPGARVSIPYITWESGDVSEISIQEGEIFWQQKSGNGLTIKSPLFHITPPAGSFKFFYDPDTVRAEVKTFEGQLEFSAMNAETSATVMPGQKVAFQGVKEDGDVAYDVLLKGRKIPKGHLSKVEAIDAGEIKEFSIEEIDKKKKEDIKRIAKQAAQKDAILPGQICRRPGAKLDECSWACENNPKGEKNRCRTDLEKVHCVRRRCNANGLWGQETVLEPGEGLLKCQAKTRVGPCDF